MNASLWQLVTDDFGPPQPGRAQRRDARGAAGRRDRLPDRGGLRVDDDEPRGRARRALARRAPAPLPDPHARWWRRRSSSSPGAGWRSCATASEALPDGPERTLAGLDLLWAHYASPLFQAALDLWTDARTDDELREHLIEVERMLDRQTLELRASCSPPRRRADFERLVENAVATVRGLALLDTLHPGGERNRQQWAVCRGGWPGCRRRLIARNPPILAAPRHRGQRSSPTGREPKDPPCALPGRPTISGAHGAES